MERLVPFAVILLSLPVGTAAQDSRAVEDARAFMVAYDKAVSDRDIAFLERALADDYVLTGATGRKSDRAGVLKYYAREREAPSYRRISLQHENVVIRALGDVAVVTNDYLSRTAPLGTPAAEPEITRGRHTGVFAKRDGRWTVVAEQDTEQPHDGSLIERQVAERSREYFRLMKRLTDGRGSEELAQSGDIATLSGLLADDFACTCGEPEITRKARLLERYRKGETTLTPVELLEQSVVAIDNNAAVERGKMRLVGTESGRRTDVVEKYTRTWVLWGSGWQVIADHVSLVKE